PVDPVRPHRRAAPVVEERIREPVAPREAARRAGEVLEVDAEDDQALAAVRAPGRLEDGGLAAAGETVRGPEVDDERLAPQRRQHQLAAAVEARQGEVRRGYRMADDGGHPGSLVPHDVPDKDA